MEEEVKYTSEFDGQTTDEVLKHAKSVKDLTIPSLSNISGFVCIDNEGKAIGMMSKEQVAQVVGGLLSSLGLYPFMDKGKASEVNPNKSLKILTSGYFYVFGNKSSITPEMEFPSFKGDYMYGVLCVKYAKPDLIEQTISTTDGEFFFRCDTYTRFQSAIIPWRKIY